MRDKFPATNPFDDLACSLAQHNGFYFYDSPYYFDRDLGLNIVMLSVDGDSYRVLERCFLELGYQPQAEAGPVRGTLFRGLEQKQAFMQEFDRRFHLASSRVSEQIGGDIGVVDNTLRQKIERLRQEHPWLGDAEITIGSGWLGLLGEMLVAIEHRLQQEGREASASTLPQVRIKEKLASLRLQISGATVDVSDITEHYRQRSLTTCELCGQSAGTVSLPSGLQAVRCQAHAFNSLVTYDELHVLRMRRNF